MLQGDPTKRPSMRNILNHPYITKNYVPSRIPPSCLTMAPRYDQGRLSIMPTDILSPRRPLGDKNYDIPQMPAIEVGKPNGRNENPTQFKHDIVPNEINLKELSKELKKAVKANKIAPKLLEETEDPASTPIFWISKWVDYTDKYGIGYQLCDNSIGVLFNDFSRIVLMADENSLQYIDRAGNEEYHTLKLYPEILLKKITLLRYFRNYMNEHLLKTGDKAVEADELTRLPYLKNWFRTRNAIVFLLNNGTVQINFFQDHIKLILCPLMNAVTYVNANREFRTFKISLLGELGCTKEFMSRIRYASEVIDRLEVQKQGTIRQ